MTAVSCENLPIIDITRENCADKWDLLSAAIQSSTFIALDIEMSGLGDRRNLSLKSIEERYKSICELANSYSILSLGVSCFQIFKYGSEDRAVKVSNRTFNLLTLCSEEFLVEPKSLKFLIDHGFDFNKQFKSGLNYYKGNDKAEDEVTSERYSVRDLFLEISQSKRAVCLHNGFIDLIFLYHSFYAKCPGSSLKFLADLEEIFAGGLYDTKYMADFHAHSSASFLQYLYKKAVYENSQCKSYVSNKYIDVHFPFDQTLLADFSLDLKSGVDFDGKEEECNEKYLCHTYSLYGYCPKIETCQKSHDINLIIHAELQAGQRKRHKKLKNKSSPVEVKSNIELNVQSSKTGGENQPHSAGLDAFMTGYVMLNYINKFTKFKKADELIDDMNTEEEIFFKDIFQLESMFRNNISLAGKDYPLAVAKSNFSSISNGHKEKKERLVSSLNNKNKFEN